VAVAADVKAVAKRASTAKNTSLYHAMLSDA